MDTSQRLCNGNSRTPTQMTRHHLTCFTRRVAFQWPAGDRNLYPACCIINGLLSSGPKKDLTRHYNNSNQDTDKKNTRPCFFKPHPSSLLLALFISTTALSFEIPIAFATADGSASARAEAVVIPAPVSLSA